MKSVLYTQVSGRREGETPVYKFDWWKLVGGVLVTTLLGWGTWVTVNCFKAEDAEQKIDMQTTVLHNRITSVQQVHEEDETRIIGIIMDLHIGETDCLDEKIPENLTGGSTGNLSR